MEDPDFGLDGEAGGLVTPYSDGIPMISYAMVDRDGRILRAYDAERVYYSASTVKVGVLVAALREVQSGAWRLGDEKVVTHEFASIVPKAGRFVMEAEETDPGLGVPGDVVTRARVIERMITVSANCATNMLFEELGPEKVRAVSLDAGVPDTGMDRPYSDEAGLEAGVTNHASALGLARLMAALVRGELLEPQWTEYAKQLLRDREEPVIGEVAAELAARIGEPVDSGGKGGAVEGIAHDFAFVERNGETVCLAVCTRAYTDPQGTAAIRAVASALLEDARGTDGAGR